MGPGTGGGLAPAGRALQQAGLDQEGFDHILERVGLLAQTDGHVLDAHRPAAEMFDDQLQVAPVQGLETQLVDSQPRQPAVGRGPVDQRVPVDLGVVAHAAQQAVGGARGAAAAAGDLQGAASFDADAQDARHCG